MQNSKRRMYSVLLAALPWIAPQLGYAQAASQSRVMTEVIVPDTSLPSTMLSQQTAQILGIDSRLEKLSSMRAQRPCDLPASLEELAIRQQLLETVEQATLDVDSVLAEISNEQGQLANLRTSLEARRDKTVAKLNAAALITGSGAGAAVSATQFTNLGARTNNIGDGLGVGAGTVSTVLSIIAVRKQNGPNGTVGQVPNMLAPLFDMKGVLNTYYPPVVLRYLQTVPADEDPSRGTRLEQLKAMWVESGRIDPDGTQRQKEITGLTSSSDPTVRVSIQDLTTRIGMLVDVAGRTSLMKRDLSAIMRSYGATPPQCLHE